jgi:hypothetical protein
MFMLFKLNMWLTSYIALLLFCTMKKRKEAVVPKKTFVIEKRSVEDDEAEIEREIQKQLEAKRESPQKSAAVVPDSEERKTYSNQAHNQSPNSSKKVVKKRIVKMMKDGLLVAEKEEILDEEGNVLKTQIRREGLSE